MARGHVRQRSEGSWQLLYHVEGKQKSETVKGTKRLAEKRLTQILREIDEGKWQPPCNLNVEEMLWKWLNEHAKERIAVTTRERYASIISHRFSPTIGTVALRELKPLCIQELYALWEKEGLSLNTRGLYHSVLHQALKWAVQLDLIPKNPSEFLKPPAAGRGARGVLDDDQIRALLIGAAGNKYHLPTVLAISVGMRVGEICGLKWEDVNLEKGYLMVRRTIARLTGGELVAKLPKSKTSVRMLPLPEMAIEALKFSRRGGDYVLWWQPSPACVSMGVKRLCDKLGLATTIHGLRHSHCSYMMRSGVPLKLAAARMGHSKPGFTAEVYQHIIPSQHEEFADRFNEEFG
jgi:integrase